VNPSLLDKHNKPCDKTVDNIISGMIAKGLRKKPSASQSDTILRHKIFYVVATESKYDVSSKLRTVAMNKALGSFQKLERDNSERGVKLKQLDDIIKDASTVRKTIMKRVHDKWTATYGDKTPYEVKASTSKGRSRRSSKKRVSKKAAAPSKPSTGKRKRPSSEAAGAPTPSAGPPAKRAKKKRAKETPVEERKRSDPAPVAESKSLSTSDSSSSADERRRSKKRKRKHKLQNDKYLSTLAQQQADMAPSKTYGLLGGFGGSGWTPSP